MQFNKITDADRAGKGNVGQSDTPNLTTLQMQTLMDALPNLSIDKFNAFIDAINTAMQNSVSAASTNDQIPTAKAVWDIFDNLDSDITNAVYAWLVAHPEATTTVQDGSLTIDKFAEPVKSEVQSIGDNPLETKSQTLSGAINELNSDLKSGFVTPEMFGAVGDGVTDDTTAIQNAVNACATVVFGSKTYLINHNGVSLNDGNRLIMKADTIIKMEATNDNAYNMLLIYNKSDVVISGGIIDGSKSTHIGSTGEQGHCIKIGGSKNVKISNVKMIDAWGDGLTIFDRTVTPENILVENCIISGVRRNGSSIVSGRNIKFINVLIEDVNGTLPKAGIDLEPDNATNILENIILENIYVKNTGGASILVDLHNNKNIFNINIIGGRFEGYAGITCQNGLEKVNGIITIKGSTFRTGGAYALFVRDWEHDSGKIIIKDTMAEVTYSGTDQWSTTPYTMAYSTDHGIEDFGNVYLDNVDVIYIDGATGTGYDIGLVNFINGTYKDIYLLNNKSTKIAGYDRFTNIKDDKTIEFENPYLYTYPSNSMMYYNLFTNKSGAGLVQIELAASTNLYKNRELEFIVKKQNNANDGIRIVPANGVTFPSDYSLGLWSKTLGSSVKFRYIENTWQIVCMTGTWTAVV